MGHVPRPRAVSLADLVEQRGAARLGQQLAAETDQAANRDHVLHPDSTVGVGTHLLEAGLTIRQGCLHRPYELGRHIHGDPLVGLVGFTVYFVEQDFGSRNLKLVAFPTHLFDEDRQLQLSASADLVSVARFGQQDFDRDIAEDLAVEPLLQLSTAHVFAFATRERRRIGAEGHA